MLSHINIGYGEDITILELAQTIAAVIEYKGNVVLDPTKPDGTPRKLLNVNRLERMGWKAKTRLIEGLRMTYQDYVNSYEKR
jgi:GDP-L-fucose synthase